MVQTKAAEPGFRRTYRDKTIQLTGAKEFDIAQFPGRLIAIEGTDGAGRSTHIALLREWLETEGHGVLHTGLSRGRLAGAGLRRAKRGTTMGPRTLDLFYATDFADRLENEILPGLRAGFVVLTDRYFYSIMARSIVRGMDAEWLRGVYTFAPEPHGVLYLRITVPNLIPRVLSRGGFDYWESGLDFQEEVDVYKSFVRYQGKLLDVFDQLAQKYRFQVIDANRGIAEVFADLKRAIQALLPATRGA